ncbi:MAG: ytrA 1 [Verrucomicrobia bacterium]|nr:ytrA 1 [Verrucomicrobiota bacterium]
MIINIDPHNGVPVYRQILDQVRFQITAGILQPGDPLDSVRSLAATLGINSMTVSKAYSMLEKERVIERRRGQQLVVAAASYTKQEMSRDAHVREALAAAITIVRQLNMPPEHALGIFREMLGEEIEENSHESYR